MTRVAIVGGGMAGLAAAWRLSRPGGPGGEITVYQRGGRLGGKGASSRGVDGRIEEHGLHVWLGYYDNAFRLMREVYDELDRAVTDPGCPIRTVSDAFSPANTIGLGLGLGDEWVATFPANDLVPGEGDSAAVTVAEVLSRLVALSARFAASLDPGAHRPRAVLSSRPRRPTTMLSDLRSGVRAVTGDPAAARRLAQFAELIWVMVRGVTADNLISGGYAAIDHLDFREWLAGHGAPAEVLDGPFVRGVYDLVFGYENGDRTRPRFAAGAGVHLASRMFLTYRGAMFWKMSAGMGDVVFAPLYQALRRRGVRFAFFHRLDHVAVDGGEVTSMTFGRQLDLAGYEPLTTVGGLPVFPARIPGVPAGVDLESHWTSWPDAGTVRLEAGRDFDTAVLAVSLGMVPYVASDLVASDARWRDMVAHVGTVPTQSVQAWFDCDEHELGVTRPGAIVTGSGAPFDTVASLSHTVAREAWPAPAPLTSLSLCTVLGDGEDVGANCDRFLEHVGVTPRSVYVRANTDPSDRYVQSLPGSGRYRMRADGSGVANLVLAGDWLDTGLNAGCIEAATLGGLQAANVVEGRPISDDTVGFRPHQQTEEVR